MIGMLINFKAVLKAFARGRRTKNLYHDFYSDEQALDIPLEVLRKKLLLDQFPIDSKANFFDFILLSLFALYGLIFSLFSLILLPLIVIYSIYQFFNLKKI